MSLRPDSTLSLVSPSISDRQQVANDSDVLKWFKSQRRGYQTQINTLLRAYMEAHR
ncbi:BrnA antitoxin family protein [Nostoc sp. CHAB 5836]|uniref:BrnA antitoxin family protein n=1 Tax=Nostoc sp. CHAB 5836 TaxID=2780404 RepID=UPI0034D964DD|nr:BrnA antitoxin family protein [Nostoc sp. CHAB 5836]